MSHSLCLRSETRKPFVLSVLILSLNRASNIFVSTDSSHSCGFTEAVIRLVISALVGVATVAMLFYDVRSGKKSTTVPKCPSEM